MAYVATVDAAGTVRVHSHDESGECVPIEDELKREYPLTDTDRERARADGIPEEEYLSSKFQEDWSPDFLSQLMGPGQAVEPTTGEILPAIGVVPNT